jgi:hypothetical protein
MEGIKEEKTFEEILKCIKDGDVIIQKVKVAVELLMKFTMEDIMEGLMMLFEAYKELYALVEPCLGSISNFKKLYEAIINADINKLIEKVIQDPFTYLAIILDCYNAFNNGEYYKAGKDAGELLHILFLEEVQLEAFDVKAFLLGFLRGLNEKGDVNELMKCAKGLESVVMKIIEAIKLLQHLDFKHLEDIIKGLSMLFQAITEMLEILKPCMDGFEQLKKLFEQLKHIDIMKIIMKILADPQTFIALVMDCIDAFKNNDWEKAGFCIGNLLYRLFLVNRL